MTNALLNVDQLARNIHQWAIDLGFSKVGISSGELAAEAGDLEQWLALGYHGSMHYMSAHGSKRYRPWELEPGTVSVISATMNYLPGRQDERVDACAQDMEQALSDPRRAYIARYALGRDYHKVLRSRLLKLARKIAAAVKPCNYRVFSDSAPVLEKPLARRAGLGWIGKHTNLINRDQGSWFFIGEIYTDLPLPCDTPQVSDHCGSCTSCITACPTRAIVAPYRLDARRCISYLTIENKKAIPTTLRSLIGNRVFGCDDCQIVCPWNRYARSSTLPDFDVRHGLNSAELLDLFAWDEANFLARTEGSALRRLSYDQWLRNLAVGLGNAPPDRKVITALRQKAAETNAAIPREHMEWAIARQKHALKHQSQ